MPQIPSRRIWNLHILILNQSFHTTDKLFQLLTYCSCRFIIMFQKKKELEQRIDGFLLKHDYESARTVCEQLEELINRMKTLV